MARREVLDEEPFDIDLEDDAGAIVDLDAVEDNEDEEDEESSSTKKSKSGALTDEDLDRYEKDKKKALDRAEAAEAAAREAADVAQAAVARLERQGGVDFKKQLAEQKANLNKSIAEKRKALKAAFDDGDGDKHATLTEELADLKGQERLLLMAEEQLAAQEKQPKRQAQPEPHAKAKAWLKENDWFRTNEEARAAAVMYGNMLERSGVSPTTDEYYEKVDENMRKRFPELYDDEERPKKKPAPVRPVERETAGGFRKTPRKVKLSPLQVRIAKQWGIPKEKMAQEVIRQRQRDGGE